jgi:hypothetical protein
MIVIQNIAMNDVRRRTDPAALGLPQKIFIRKRRNAAVSPTQNGSERIPFLQESICSRAVMIFS